MEKVSGMAENTMLERTQQYISSADKKRFRDDILSLTGALVCLAAGLIYLRFQPEQDVVAATIYIVGTLVIGLPVLITAIRGIVYSDISAAMEILVSIAIIISALNKQYIIAILIPVILTLVHFLEEKSIIGGRDAIEGLKKMQAETALLFKDGMETEVDAKTLAIGDVVVIKPGAALPIDGEVISGVSNIDQKSLTGEPLPQEVHAGLRVFAGTTNIDGEITVRVEKAYTDTSFQQIVRLLNEAENINTPETRIVDKFMSYYIPLTLVVATLVWLFTQDISKAVAILVVSCPCGHMLINSAPMIAALSAASKRGLLIKNSAFSEKLADVGCIVFDKTGTLTKGDLEPSNYYLETAESFEELVATAAIVTRSSLHPVSKSITAICRETINYEGYIVTEYIGKGMEGTSGDNRIVVGTRRWLVSLGYKIPDSYEDEGTASWVAKNDTVFGCILFKDTPRKDAAEMILALAELGIEKTVLLTGDSENSAEKIRSAVGIKQMYCQLLPEQKLDKVNELMKISTVCVVGDGINDALALSKADVGIAMGAMGSDTAIQSADIALMNNELANISFAIKLAQNTKSIIYQNIVISFLSSFIMIFLAATGVVTAIAGAFLHNIGAFLVLFNSGRLLRNKPSVK